MLQHLHKHITLTLTRHLFGAWSPFVLLRCSRWSLPPTRRAPCWLVGTERTEAAKALGIASRDLKPDVVMTGISGPKGGMGAANRPMTLKDFSFRSVPFPG